MQKVFHNYKSDLDSFEFNSIQLGLIEPGLYRGFDIATPTGLQFTLDHSLTGIERTLQNLSTTNKTGIIYTKQGCIIQEDAAIGPLTFGSNAGNGFERLDLIVCDHEYVASIGGQPATYSVIQGANGGPVLPALTSPEKQIIIGVVSIPASAANLSTSTYTRAFTPFIGNKKVRMAKQSEPVDISNLQHSTGFLTVTSTPYAGPPDIVTTNVLPSTMMNLTTSVLDGKVRAIQISSKSYTSDNGATLVIQNQVGDFVPFEFDIDPVDYDRDIIFTSGGAGVITRYDILSFGVLEGGDNIPLPDGNGQFYRQSEDRSVYFGGNFFIPAGITFHFGMTLQGRWYWEQRLQDPPAGTPDPVTLGKTSDPVVWGISILAFRRSIDT